MMPKNGSNFHCSAAWTKPEEAHSLGMSMQQPSFSRRNTCSKKLSEKKRELLFPQIQEQAIAYCIATASVAEIEAYNILGATMLAMQRAVAGLSVQPNHVLIDGNRMPELSVSAETVVKGDAHSATIAAASILAKVARDHYLLELDRQYPQYGFAQHKGYGTKAHCAAILQYGASPVHRKAFLRKLLQGHDTK